MIPGVVAQAAEQNHPQEAQEVKQNDPAQGAGGHLRPGIRGSRADPNRTGQLSAFSPRPEPAEPGSNASSAEQLWPAMREVRLRDSSPLRLRTCWGAVLPYPMSAGKPERRLAKTRQAHT